MRERVTFVHPPDVDLDPELLDVQEAGMLGPQIDTTRQDRFTASKEELPQDVADLLANFQEVHIRWASPFAYETLDPLTSRLSPGFHLSYTPLKDKEDQSSKLCTFLQLFGDLECSSPNNFISAGSEADSLPHAPAFNFYQQLEDLHKFITYATQNICPELDTVCQARTRSLYTASSLDISFDSASDSLVLTTVWPLRAQNIAVPASSERRIEVGILAKDEPPHLESHELGVAGILNVLGESKKPSPAIFTFPSRHRQTTSVFSSKFLAPTGLHPTLQLTISSNQPPAQDASCAPFAYLTLPKTIFADRYQLADELFLASKNLTASRYMSSPVDLEAPAYTTETWGSNVLLELSPPTSEESSSWTAEIPLHLRYLEPSNKGKVDIEVPYPTVFWACSSGVDRIDSPFDRVKLGYDGHFQPGTSFWHVTPTPETGNRIMNSLTVPVLRDTGGFWIGFGTAIVVGVGFAWVIWKLADVLLSEGDGPSKATGSSTKIHPEVKKE